LYIKDAVKATLWFYDQPEHNGVYNIGTGQARTWNDVAEAMFAAVGKESKIEYIDMPKQLQKGYQSFTQADISKLKATSYNEPFASLEDAITDYIQNYLEPHKHLGE
jgi:ADP-L-glycero-D-manno-heptose 6-epimerase